VLTANRLSALNPKTELLTSAYISTALICRVHHLACVWYTLMAGKRQIKVEIVDVLHYRYNNHIRNCWNNFMYVMYFNCFCLHFPGIIL
jgi:hypothetical protein